MSKKLTFYFISLFVLRGFFLRVMFKRLKALDIPEIVIHGFRIWVMPLAALTF